MDIKIGVFHFAAPCISSYTPIKVIFSKLLLIKKHNKNLYSYYYKNFNDFLPSLANKQLVTKPEDLLMSTKSNKKMIIGLTLR